MFLVNRRNYYLPSSFFSFVCFFLLLSWKTGGKIKFLGVSIFLSRLGPFKNQVKFVLLILTESLLSTKGLNKGVSFGVKLS